MLDKVHEPADIPDRIYSNLIVVRAASVQTGKSQSSCENLSANV